jgi:hypothetical protein
MKIFNLESEWFGYKIEINEDDIEILYSIYSKLANDGNYIAEVEELDDVFDFIDENLDILFEAIVNYGTSADKKVLNKIVDSEYSAV